MPKAPIKPSALSPLWALLCLRSVRAIQGRLMPSGRQDAWGLMPGLRLAHPDPDRPPSRWSETWHEAVRQRLDAVEAHPLLAIPTPHPRGPEPCEIATALASGDALPGVVWNALPASPCPPLASEAIGWRLPVPAPAVGWPADVLEQLLACRPASQQVWLIVPSEAEGWTWWSDSRFKDTLRWGASWWFEAPSTTAGWDAYGQTLSAVARRLLTQPEAEQWVWPIADILQQALEEIMRTGGLHSRTGAPWGGGCAEEWARLRRTLWTVAQECFGGGGALEDVTAGVVFASLKKGWNPDPIS